jgi:glycosyltransferase involved in cell wall biosynthesis
MNTEKLGMPLLSVIVPITRMANRLGTLKKWIQDCQYQNLEIILVHDKRDDETGIELVSIIEENPNLHLSIIEGKFGAPGIARNAGLIKATGKWIVFWDCDDQPNLENVCKILQEEEIRKDNRVEVVIGQFSTSRNNIYINKTLRIRDITLMDVALNPGLWRMVFRRNTIKNFRFTDSKMAEDQNFISMIDLPKLRYKFVDIHFYTYHLGVQNQLTSKSEAINDISKAISITLIKLNNCNGESKEFNGMLFIRQVITGITKGSPFVKLSSIKFLSIALFFSGLQTSSTILKNFTFLAKSKNRKL